MWLSGTDRENARRTQGRANVGLGLRQLGWETGLSILNAWCCFSVFKQNMLFFCVRKLIPKSRFLHKEITF